MPADDVAAHGDVQLVANPHNAAVPVVGVPMDTPVVDTAVLDAYDEVLSKLGRFTLQLLPSSKGAPEAKGAMRSYAVLDEDGEIALKIDSFDNKSDEFHKFEAKFVKTDYPKDYYKSVYCFRVSISLPDGRCVLAITSAGTITSAGRIAPAAQSMNREEPITIAEADPNTSHFGLLCDDICKEFCMCDPMGAIRPFDLTHSAQDSVQLFAPKKQPAQTFHLYVVLPVVLCTCCSGPAFMAICCCIYGPPVLFKLKALGSGAEIAGAKFTEVLSGCIFCATTKWAGEFSNEASLQTRRDMLTLVAFKVGVKLFTPDQCGDQ